LYLLCVSFRVADYSIAVARNALTYNLPAKLAIETVDVLKRFAAILEMHTSSLLVRRKGKLHDFLLLAAPRNRYGLTGFTGLMLRKDFLESVELLKRISGMVCCPPPYPCRYFICVAHALSLSHLPRRRACFR
jgi:hypothetical protein